jgi:thymidylate synthase
MTNSEEKQYIDLIKEILENGSLEEGRNGKTYSIFGYSMRYSLSNGTVPLLTTKKVAWRTCFKELLWFMRGSTDNAELTKAKVYIWNGNSSRAFLDSRGLVNNAENDLGPVYGHQWRHFNAPYTDCHYDYSGQGVDQLQNIIDMLKTPEGRKSRRLVLSAWNPCQLDEMALPPCHVLMQFDVRQDKYLSCSLYQRSGDVGLGVPFNIASYSFLTHIIAAHCDLVADKFVHFIGNAHIYEQHVEPLKEQISREPYAFPQIEPIQKCEKIEDYSLDHIHWNTEYKYHGPIQMEMLA